MSDSEEFDLVIEGGTVIDEHNERALDVYVRNGQIAALTEPNERLAARHTLEARGLAVLPGMIDAHTHFRTWSKHSDTFGEMSDAAAAGGITTVAGFVMGMNAEGTTLASRVRECLAEASSTSPIDFAFHAAIADEEHTLDELSEMIDLGVTSFKMFMINRARRMMVDDGFLLTAMKRISDLGGLPMVHAELEDLSMALAAEARTDRELTSVQRFVAARPTWLEAEATRRAIQVAKQADVPLYVVHVTCEDALNEIRRARQQGLTVFAETCPQYLSLTDDAMSRQGGLVKVAPPLRSERDRQTLVDAVLNGEIDVVSSDHAPYTRQVKTDATTDFLDIPVGMPGTQTLVGVTWKVLSEAGGSPHDLVRVLAATPARVFGLTGKGRIDVGSDADITLVDFTDTTTVSVDDLHGPAGYSAYEGWRLPLRIVETLQRGESVLKNDAVRTNDVGRFISREPHRGGTEARR
ncbi:dihydroorotase family protein [Microbacterium sp. MPKO10]|uniref:dihydroorotase n=1 Tax=Microbacterium sp. MPKO10 TaxID=2989818 RepID=UPI0022356F12|nr:amidohydrolase family protein [Microbacterium sp. MPKO10]MCW4459858.1 amidohydrolase family protein [Microbacterium sp. MPKO10]